MSLSQNGKNFSIEAKNVRFDDTYLHIELMDGRIISTPLDWYKELKNANLPQLKNWKFICKGTGIEWTDLDYHLSIESMFLIGIDKAA